MKLEEGKRYRARSGEVFGPLYRATGGLFAGERYPFRSRGKSIYSWTEEGRYDLAGVDHALDLVEEVSGAEPAAPAVDEVTVGDLNSGLRGTGARKSAGKPDWSQIPWWTVGPIYNAWGDYKTSESAGNVIQVIELMSRWQRGDDAALERAAALLLTLIARRTSPCVVIKEFPIRALESTVRVLEFGAKKYAKGNWAKGMSWSVCFTCTMSHLSKAFQGEENDEESGISHLAHAMCNMLFLLGYRDLYPEGDDRLPEFRAGGTNKVDLRHD